MIKMLNYSDFVMVPDTILKVDSRSECDFSIKFGNRTFAAPVVPANMPSVINEKTCEFLAKENFFYIYHRYGMSILDFSILCYKRDIPFCSVSIGINEDSKFQLSEYLNDHGQKTPIDYITIDVANAYSNKTKDMISFIKKHFPNTYLIVGNIGGQYGRSFLRHCGVNCTKVGIGPGSACSTYDKTGFLATGILQYGDTKKIRLSVDRDPDVDILVDGGIKKIGDISKAVALGATMVMAGNLFAGYNESAGRILETEDGEFFKEHYGNASEFVKQDKRHIEGKKILVDYKGSMKDLLEQIKEGLQSSVSYAGGKDLSALRNVEIVTIKG